MSKMFDIVQSYTWGDEWYASAHYAHERTDISVKTDRNHFAYNSHITPSYIELTVLDRTNDHSFKYFEEKQVGLNRCRPSNRQNEVEERRGEERGGPTNTHDYTTHIR